MIKYLLVLLFIIFISCNAEKVINNKPIDNTPIENNSIDNNPIDNNPINDNPIDNKKNVNIKNLKITLNEQTYSYVFNQKKKQEIIILESLMELHYLLQV